MIYESLRQLPANGAGTVRPSPATVVRVSGPDAVEFLHRICSQDVASLADGAIAPACFLSPKGKLVATALLARLGATVWAEVAAASAAALREYLDRFHFTERLELGVPDGWSAAEIRGPEAWHVASFGQPGCREQDGRLVIAAESAGLRRVGIHGPAAAVEAWIDGLGLPELDPELAGVLRLASRQLAVGVDTDDTTIALEAPVEDHISTTKGCYTGQEIVARIHTYGHVNRKLVLLRVEGGEPVEAGTTLYDPDEGEPVGRATSGATLPDGASRLLYGYVPRELAAPGTELRIGEAGGRRAQVVGFGPA